MSYEIFDKYYKEYDLWYYENKIIAENELLALRVLKPEGLGLEIGVGTGYFAEKLNIQVGIDPSRNMLKIARSRGIEVVQAFGERLPFREKVFDYVYIIVTICFVKDPLKVLMEAYRVLKDEGKLIVAFIPRDSSWGRYYLEKKKNSVFYKHARLYSLNEVVNLIRLAGFRIIRSISTLHFHPEDPPRLEYPKEDTNGGFVCLLSEKV
ncbi:MAG: class I SAM-dependent methyltransferase [Euryarchaeota archaeon]|nr:class I SAM-dependent methyltransferase [Euryarchaeota archaeon]